LWSRRAFSFEEVILLQRKNPLLKAALCLHRIISQGTRRPSMAEASAETAVDCLRSLERHLKRCRLARRHNWAAAEAAEQRSLADQLRHLYYLTAEAVTRGQPPKAPMHPTPRDLYQELIQLRDEFSDVDIQPGVISVVTEPVELEGVHLGTFRIELRTGYLADRKDSNAFNIVALDPHPAAADDSVVHPHVRDGQLCAGEATTPIAYALADGRLCDAFLAVHGVLQHYNPGSPYVRLDEWEGQACADCGCIVNNDGRYWCEDCQQDYCGDCFSCCEICDASCCRGCLEQDRESDRLCCRRCQRRCSSCSRIVDIDSFVEETELCPACHEDHLNEQEEESNDDQEQPDSGEQVAAAAE
jgi:hypothetical protein